MKMAAVKSVETMVRPISMLGMMLNRRKKARPSSLSKHIIWFSSQLGTYVSE